VLLSLLDAGEAGFLFREDLPPEVMDAAIVHDARDVRAIAADSGRLSPAQWGRLIATTPDPRQRALFEECAGEQLAARRLSRGGRGVGRAAGEPGAIPRCRSKPS
jgi:hypothetical protein